MQEHLVSERDFIIKLNWKLFGGAVGFTAAWLFWPTSYEWWGFALHSIVFGIGGALSLSEAIRLVLEHRRKKKTITSFTRAGTKPKSSRTVSDCDLDKAGMF